MPRDLKGKTICISASDGRSLTNFRGNLIKGWVHSGARVICSSIESEDEMKIIKNELGAEYYQIPGNRTGIGIRDGIKMIFRYLKFYKLYQPDMCFLYMSKPIAFGGIAARWLGLKNVNILVNGLENAFYRSGIKDRLVRVVMSTLYKYVTKTANNVFFQNVDDLNFFKDHSLLKRNNASIVLGSGVDMEHFAKTPLPDKAVLLMTARLLWSKGIREYLEAVKIVKAKYPYTEVMLVGGLDNNDEAITKEDLEEAITEFGIKYCGYTTDVRPYLNKCSIYVLPSYHEGLPRSVLEAMSVGRPIITTNAPGCKETVVDGTNGYLVPVKNAEILANAIEKLVTNPELRTAMGNKSYEICKAKFEVNLINNEMNNKMFRD